jgi:tripartite-type tricarboxylate transporter receptor subunit TctC
MRVAEMVRASTVSLALLLTWGASALADTYPSRPIRLVVPFPAGGATDTMARLISQGLSTRLGQQIVIENQGGAGGTLGARQVAQSAPDGYTLLMMAANTFGTSPRLYKLDYDPLTSFAPIGTVAVDRQILVVSPTVPVTTVRELVDYAKANPGKLNYGSATGIGPHFVMELFKLKSGANIVHIPYRGGAPMISDLLGGQIQATVNGKSVLLPHIVTGKMRALAVAGPQRLRELPDVPTLVEAGYLDYPYDALFGLVTRTGTPPEAIARLSAALAETLQAPDTQAGFARLGIETRVTSAQQFGAIIAEEAPKWAEVVKLTGIKVD